jgi:hypothetical protein
MVEGIVGARRMDRDSATILRITLTYGIPLVIVCFFFARPVRFGLALGAVLLTHMLQERYQDASLYSDRSFFGIISVKQSGIELEGKDGKKVVRRYNQLLHGTTDHGMSFLPPQDASELGDPRFDLSRLATTYYHRYGPAGRVMEGYNWFKDFPLNTYHADARMPAAIVGQAAAAFGGAMPYANFVNVWSEPAFATIGLGTGTMASYGRPYQHVHYYEIDNHIRKLSLPKKPYYTYEEVEAQGGSPYFSYLKGAISRGCEVQVLMGDARLRMALPYKNFHTSKNEEVPGGGPMNFYHMMVVDAFSSDAIPAHLITKEAIKMYFDRLTEEGILCVHTSNRYVSLPKVVAAVTLSLNNDIEARANELRKKHPDLKDEEIAKLYPDERVFGYEFVASRGHDQSPRGHQGPLNEGREIGHYTSEWVMVARKAKYLERLTSSPNYESDLREASNKAPGKFDPSEPYWRRMNGDSKYLWTDNYYTLWTVLRILQPKGSRDD